MKNLQIVLFSMSLSACIVMIYHYIRIKHLVYITDKALKRIDYLTELARAGKIKVKHIKLEKDNNVKYKKHKFFNRNRVCIDNETYTDKDYWFAYDNGMIILLSKREDVMVEIECDWINETENI